MIFADMMGGRSLCIWPFLESIVYIVGLHIEAMECRASRQEIGDPIFEWLAARVSGNKMLESSYMKGIWNISLTYQPLPGERLFRYEVLLVQTDLGQGASYASSKFSGDLSSLVGKTVASVQAMDMLDYPLKVAILDSVYASFPLRKADYEAHLSGVSNEKAVSRAQMIYLETSRLLNIKKSKNMIKGEKPAILNIGYVSKFRNIMKDQFPHDFLATDLYEGIVGHALDGITIEDGNSRNEEFMRKADVAIITGMTIATGTLSRLLNMARKYATSVIIFAETGYNLAPYYLNFGADAVICEEFPYYIFNGFSTVKVYRESNPLTP